MASILAVCYNHGATLLWPGGASTPPAMAQRNGGPMSVPDCSTPPAGHKRCSRCGLDLPSTEFHRDRRRQDGLQAWCKGCHKQQRAVRLAVKRPPVMNGERQCPRCGETKDVREFYVDGRNPHGRKYWCKSCTSADRADWVRRHPERQRQTMRAWREENADHIKEYERQYYQKNRERKNMYRAEWARKNPERAREHRRRDRANNPESHRRRQRRYYLRHREAILAYGREYRRAHPEVARASCHRRRARIAGAARIEHFTRDEIWERDGGRCHVCGKKCDPRDWHLDHLVPISRGGEHTRLNVAVSHPTCNHRRFVSGPAQLRMV